MPRATHNKTPNKDMEASTPVKLRHVAMVPLELYTFMQLDCLWWILQSLTDPCSSITCGESSIILSLHRHATLHAYRGVMCASC